MSTSKISTRQMSTNTYVDIQKCRMRNVEAHIIDKSNVEYMMSMYIFSTRKQCRNLYHSTEQSDTETACMFSPYIMSLCARPRYSCNTFVFFVSRLTIFSIVFHDCHRIYTMLLLQSTLHFISSLRCEFLFIVQSCRRLLFLAFQPATNAIQS